MNNDFSVLARFLDSLGPEVSGHSASPLSPEQMEQIQLFAKGQLSGDQRDALLPDILENDKALHELVEALKSAS